MLRMTYILLLAALSQLSISCASYNEKNDINEPGATDVVKVAKDALTWAESQNGNVIIFDTAGRQEIDERLVDELKRLHSFLEPQETLLVADAATGQGAVSVAKHFDAAVGISGIILTKLDGDARGGAALSMRAVTGKPIKYAGEGEKLDQLFDDIGSKYTFVAPDPNRRVIEDILVGAGVANLSREVEQVIGELRQERFHQLFQLYQAIALEHLKDRGVFSQGLRRRSLLC